MQTNDSDLRGDPSYFQYLRVSGEEPNREAISEMDMKGEAKCAKCVGEGSVVVCWCAGALVRWCVGVGGVLVWVVW